MTGGPTILVFDLDDTLAPSKSRIAPSMADLLARSLDRADVCIISGGRLEQFQAQVLTQLPPSARLSGLHLMPTCGTRYLRFQDSAWVEIYAHDLDPDERDRVVGVLTSSARELGLWTDQTWGPIIEDRGSQVTFSALGQRAPVSEKAAWDPDGARKSALRDHVAARLPTLEVRSGGSTSIDVTRKGIDKAFGIKELCRAMAVDLDALLFVGDRLDEGGNDYPVKALGVRCVAVENPEETEKFLQSYLTGQAGV